MVLLSVLLAIRPVQFTDYEDKPHIDSNHVPNNHTYHFIIITWDISDSSCPLFREFNVTCQIIKIVLRKLNRDHTNIT